MVQYEVKNAELPSVGRKKMISQAYREEQERLHENPNYGVASIEYAPLVSQLINMERVKVV